MAIQNLKSILKRATLELKAADSESAEFDARVLLEAAIDKKTDYIFSHPEAPMSNADYARFRRYIRRRKKGEPAAYILGHKEFFGLDFYVNKNVLIPRPETEWLVEEALDRMMNYELEIKVKAQEATTKKIIIHNSSFMILDIGTGSGCIIIALAKEIKTLPLHPRTGTKWYSLERFKFYGVDISSKALVVAKKNAQRILFETESRELKSADSSHWNLSQAKTRDSNNIIKFYRSDLFSNPRLPKKFDLIIANLPYVPKGTVPGHQGDSPRTLISIIPNSISFEPTEAIFAGENGTAIIKRFLTQMPSRINEDGMILIELDPRNAKIIHRFAQKQFPQAKIELKKDLAKLDRYLKISL